MSHFMKPQAHTLPIFTVATGQSPRVRNAANAFDRQKFRSSDGLLSWDPRMRIKISLSRFLGGAAPLYDWFHCWNILTSRMASSWFYDRAQGGSLFLPSRTLFSIFCTLLRNLEEYHIIIAAHGPAWRNVKRQQKVHIRQADLSRLDELCPMSIITGNLPPPNFLPHHLSLLQRMVKPSLSLCNGQRTLRPQPFCGRAYTWLLCR